MFANATEHNMAEISLTDLKQI